MLVINKITQTTNLGPECRTHIGVQSDQIPSTHRHSSIVEQCVPSRPLTIDHLRDATPGKAWPAQGLARKAFYIDSPNVEDTLKHPALNMSWLRGPDPMVTEPSSRPAEVLVTVGLDHRN